MQYYVYVIYCTHVRLSISGVKCTSKNNFYVLMIVKLCSTVPSLFSCTGSPYWRGCVSQKCCSFWKKFVLAYLMVSQFPLCTFRCSAAVARAEDCASFAASLPAKTAGHVIAEQREYIACSLQASDATDAVPEGRKRGLSLPESICAAWR